MRKEQNLFSITIRATLQSPGFLLVALWICEVFAHELYWFAKLQIFGFLLIPVPGDKYAFAESILEIPLAGFFFLAYHSALTNALMIIQKKDSRTGN